MTEYMLGKNPYQGAYVKMLFVCTGGILRSPTAAHVMAAEGHNTRSAGCYPDAVPPVTETLIRWADVVYCMGKEHQEHVLTLVPEARMKTQVMNIPDNYEYRHPKLIKLIRDYFNLDA